LARWTLHTDGGARGNPGPAGIGFVLHKDDRLVCHGGDYLGETTNNVAEYEALIWGLENARTLGATALEVFADSELMVKQLTGVYRVKNANLRPLHARATAVADSIGDVSFTHVRREENHLADDLANKAMDAQGFVGDATPRGAAPAQQSLFE
jgi:ribonuclease HI